MGLKEFGPELLLKFFPDNTFTLKQWEHLCYLKDSDLIEEHFHLANGRSTKYAHADYSKNGHQEKEKLLERVKLLNTLLV